jgi:hypothetical protein
VTGKFGNPNICESTHTALLVWLTGGIEGE